MAGRPRRTRGQLLKEAAEADREALLLSRSLSGLAGLEAVDRARKIQGVYDRARALRNMASET